MGPLCLCDSALDSGKLSLSPYATHIRERINGRSLSCEEFVGRAPKDLPDRLESMAEPRQPVMKVVSKEDEVKEPSRSPDAVAAPVQPCDISPVCPVAIPACLSSGGTLPLPVGAARGQCSLLVVSAKCAASAQHLLMFEAAERQSMSPVAPSRAAEGEWLARAAEYIWEHVSERYPTCEEFGCRAPKKLPDKVAEIMNEPQQHALNVINKGVETSMVGSPEVKAERVNKLSCSRPEPVQAPGLGKTGVLSHSLPETTTLRSEANFGIPWKKRQGAGLELHIEAAAVLGCSGECLPNAWEPAVWAPSFPLAERPDAVAFLRPCPSMPTVAASHAGVPEVDRELARRAPELLGQPFVAGRHVLYGVNNIDADAHSRPPELVMATLLSAPVLAESGQACTFHRLGDEISWPAHARCFDVGGETQRTASVVIRSVRLSDKMRSLLSGAAYMPPNPLHLTLLRLVVALSMLVVTPGATHDIVGRLVNTNVPRSRSCLVVC